MTQTLYRQGFCGSALAPNAGTGRASSTQDRAHLVRSHDKLPSCPTRVVNTVVDGNTVVLEVLACGTHDGVLDLPGEAPVQPKGAELRLPMTLVLVFDGGRLRTERLYFDQLTMLRQVDGPGAWASNVVSG
jgi:hypothetical protein